MIGMGTSCLTIGIGDELSWGPVVGDELSGGQLTGDELTKCQIVTCLSYMVTR